MSFVIAMTESFHGPVESAGRLHGRVCAGQAKARDRSLGIRCDALARRRDGDDRGVRADAVLACAVVGDLLARLVVLTNDLLRGVAEVIRLEVRHERLRQRDVARQEEASGDAIVRAVLLHGAVDDLVGAQQLGQLLDVVGAER